jgi:hypothetical protein
MPFVPIQGSVDVLGRNTLQGIYFSVLLAAGLQRSELRGIVVAPIVRKMEASPATPAGPLVMRRA